MRVQQVVRGVSIAALWTAAILGAGPARAQVGEAAGAPSVTVRDIVPLETVLGFVAFDQDIPDEQLLQVRRTLRSLYAKREQVITQIVAGRMDMREVRSRVFSLRRQMLQGLSIILEEEQSQELFRAMGEGLEGEDEEGPQ